MRELLYGNFLYFGEKGYDAYDDCQFFSSTINDESFKVIAGKIFSKA